MIQAILWAQWKSIRILRFGSGKRSTIFSIITSALWYGLWTVAAIGLASAMMLMLTATVWMFAPALIRGFSSDPQVVAFGSEYLTIVSLNFLASGIAFSSSSVFQGLGNTVPPLVSTATRLFLFALPAVLLSRTAGFHIRQVWYLSVISQVVAACLILLLLRRELGQKLKFDEVPIAGPVMEVG